jgi:sugar phosphate isomerase/epimerase
MTQRRALGWCAPLVQAAAVRDAGYDFLEAPLMGFGLDDAAGLAAACHALDDAPIPVPVFNSFYPRDMRVVGPDVDAARIQTYLRRAAEMAHHAGARVAVLGSAWARNVPDGFSRDVVRTQILENFHAVADAFSGSGVVIGIEPQNRKEANIITSLAEAVDYARAVNRPEIRVTADFYHMDEEREPLSQVTAFADWIVHVQLADSGRLNPGTGQYDYAAFFQCLEDGGYAGAVSVECMVPIAPPQMRRSQEFLRGFWK